MQEAKLPSFITPMMAKIAEEPFDSPDWIFEGKLDGEGGPVDEKGIPRFQLLQRFQKQPTAPTLYYVFDVLWCDGEDITGKPVVERRKGIDQALHRMKPLSTDKSPFDNPPKVKEKIQWIE